MTIAGTTIQTSGSTGNGATTQFNFSFHIDPNGYGATTAASQIQVTRETIATGAETVLTLTTDYSVTINADQSSNPGGYITMVSAPSSAYKIWIRLNPDFTQKTDMQAQGAFNAEVVEDEFDQLTRKTLWLKDSVRRAPRVGVQAGTSFDGEVTGDLTAGAVFGLKSDLSGYQLYANNGSSTAVTATGATTARTLADRFAEVLTPEDFGAVGNGSTDDLTALTAWLNAVMASSSRVGSMAAKTYAISGALPQINVSGVRILGAGPSSSHDVGSAGGTIIKAITNTGFVMLTVAPTEGASAQRLDSVIIDGVTFDGNSKATKGLLVKSLLRGALNVTAIECTTSGLEFDVATTLGESRDTQRCVVRFTGRQITNAAPALRLKGDSGANTSFMLFDYVDIIHKNEVGIISENADNNSWGDVRIIKAAGGSATYSWEMRGGATGALAARAELIYQLSTTVAVIAKGTGTYTVGAGYKGANDPAPIQVHYLDVANGTPLPVVEAGASLHVHSSKGTDAPSASTTDLARYSADFTDITGTTGITSFGYAPSGSIRHVRFTGALTLTHNGTSFILPGSANITTAANDTATFVSLGSGNWLCASYKRADGQPIGAVAHTQITANPTPGTGSYTTASGTLRYNVVNGRVSFTWNGSITTVGTGATDLRFTLPFAAETYTPFVGIRTSTGTPLVASAAAASSTVICTLAGGADPNGNYFFSVAGSYEADV